MPGAQKGVVMRKKGTALSPNEIKRKEAEIMKKVRHLLQTGEILRGNLTERKKVCGTAGCRCSKGEKHAALYLVQSRGGKLRQLYVPADLAEIAREWVCNYQILQQLLDELSDLGWSKMEAREL